MVTAPTTHTANAAQTIMIATRLRIVLVGVCGNSSEKMAPMPAVITKPAQDSQSRRLSLRYSAQRLRK